MKLFRLFVLLIIIFCLGVGLWYKIETSPVNKAVTTKQLFVVDQGSGVKAIAQKLAKAHLIKSPLAFYLTVKQLGIENNIQAGDFQLSPSQSSEEIAKSLTKGAQDIWITIPEGKRAEEVAQILKNNLPGYEPEWETELKAEEGYLFPDTYQVHKKATINQIISLLTSEFEQKYATITNRTNLSRENIVILASLIEREAQKDEDRPLISSVLHNRLEIGMPLQVDATIQYALGYDYNGKTWWKRDLTLDDLKYSSPYNTYLNVGLPPGPIASPGVKALEAAVNPAKTNYLYYITDKNGMNHYAKSLTEHNANIKKYGL